MGGEALQINKNIKTFSSFLRDFSGVFFHRSLVLLIIIGNGTILTVSFLFYFLEKGLNPHLKGPLDALWFSFSTTTTVGYGDVIPVTSMGKILGICMMLLGPVFFSAFTAIFVNLLLSKNFQHLRHQVKEMNVLEKHIDKDEEEIRAIVKQMQQLVNRLEDHPRFTSKVEHERDTFK